MLSLSYTYHRPSTETGGDIVPPDRGIVPLSTDAQGQIMREVAPARIALPRPDHAGGFCGQHRARAPHLNPFRSLARVRSDMPAARVLQALLREPSPQAPLLEKAWCAWETFLQL